MGILGDLMRTIMSKQSGLFAQAQIGPSQAGGIKYPRDKAECQVMLPLTSEACERVHRRWWWLSTVMERCALGSALKQNRPGPRPAIGTSCHKSRTQTVGY
jgi:hypothetical protein